MYAVVKAGGKQHKVGVGDTFTVNRLVGEAGDTLTLPAVLLVDGEDVTSDAQALAGVTVTGEIVGHGKGGTVNAEARGSDFHSALDAAVAKLEAQLRRTHDRVCEHHARHQQAAVAPTQA